MEFPRALLPELLRWLERPEAIAIKGPRQSGKTTLLGLLRAELLRRGVPEQRVVVLNFEDRELLERFAEEPKAVVESHLAGQERHYVLMDEYQYVPEGGQKLKLLVDTLPLVKFVVTGSSSLELAAAFGRFLVGRVFFFELLPLSFAECLSDQRLARLHQERAAAIHRFLRGGTFKLEKDVVVDELRRPFEEYLLHGGYPAVVKAAAAGEKEMVLKGIFDTYISRDIIEFLRVADAARYRCLVKQLALRMGGQVDYAELASSCQSYYHDVKRTLSILAETYVLRLVPPFFRNPATELRKMPKAYFLDTGLRNMLASNFNRLEERSDAGLLAENAAFIGLSRIDPNVRYWRTIAKAEVDFVLETAAGIVPVEVKYRAEPALARGMRSFIRSYKPERALVLTKDVWRMQRIEGCRVLFAPLACL